VISLQGKRVLYFAPKFFGYDSVIAEEFIRRGALLDMLPDRVFDSPLMTGITKLRRNWVIPAANKFYRNKIECFARERYDMVFVVNGQTLSKEILQELRIQYPSATFVLYMWDAIKNRQSTIDNLDCFDACFTFDMEDSEHYKMIFRPLFFSKGFEKQSANSYLYNISFVGTAHTDRYKLVKSVTSNLPSGIKHYWYLYLQAPWVFYYYKLVNPAYQSARRSEFMFKPILKEEVQNIFFTSQAILDIEHPGQKGLTIRTIETLGSSKKLITTNEKIREYDFFSADNICVIDRKKPLIAKNFFSTDYSSVTPNIYRKYSLAGWLDEILSHCFIQNV
jgi:hypothetical protein